MHFLVLIDWHKLLAFVGLIALCAHFVLPAIPKIHRQQLIILNLQIDNHIVVAVLIIDVERLLLLDNYFRNILLYRILIAPSCFAALSLGLLCVRRQI